MIDDLRERLAEMRAELLERLAMRMDRSDLAMRADVQQCIEAIEAVERGG
jgi:hypothetical protein